LEDNAGLKSNCGMKISQRGKRLLKPSHVDMEKRSKNLKTLDAINTLIVQVEVSRKGNEKSTTKNRGLRNRGRAERVGL
jgi:hypothetical protein